MKPFKIFPLLLSCFLLSNLAFAQEIWTLQKCIDRALENNIQLKQSKLDVQAKSASLRQSRLDLLPNLNGRASHSYSLGRTIDPTTNLFDNKLQSNSFSLSSGLNLWDGMRTINTIRQNKFNFEASKYDVESARNNLILYVLTSYLEVLLYKDQVNVATSQVGITEQQIEKTKILVEVGKVAEGTLFEIEAQLANEELTLVNAQNLYSLALLDLSQLIEIDLPESFIIERPGDDQLNAEMLDALELEGIYANAVNTLPVIKSSKLKVKSAERGIGIARSSLYPSLSMFTSLSSNYSNIVKRAVGDVQPTYVITGFVLEDFTPIYAPIYDLEDVPFSDQIDNNYGQALGFTLSVPIFNGYAARTAITHSKLNLLYAQFNLDIAENVLRKNIQQAFANAKASQKKYFASLDNVKAVEKSFSYTQEKFDLKIVTAFDFNIAKNNVAAAKSDLIQARYDMIFSIKILDFYQGKPLNF